jgi:hypothetical protein
MMMLALLGLMRQELALTGFVAYGCAISTNRSRQPSADYITII